VTTDDLSRRRVRGEDIAGAPEPRGMDHAGSGGLLVAMVGCRGSLTIRDSVRRKLRRSYAAHAGVSVGIKSAPSAGASKKVATITVSPPVGLKAEWTWP
jgi:hypothetical protein